jgi:D-glycero-beta-D-manno-heptose-7-phosphate kinase
MLQKFQQQHILIVGDVMIDRYLMGAVTRISPEAPVPVVLQHEMEDRLGGAANVALNVHALGGVPLLCSVVGNDKDGAALKDSILPRFGILGVGLVASNQRRTTVKTRVLGNNQQMLRIDQEDTHDLEDEDAQMLFSKVVELLDQYPVRVIILQDYNKGVLTSELIQVLIKEAQRRGILTTVDPKKSNFFAYQGVNLFKPNLKEIRDSTPFEVQTSFDSLQRAADFLRERLQNKSTMITLSEKGLFLDGGKGGKIYPTIPRTIADVSGAGDTVISIASLGLAAGLDWEDIAILSNLAGGQVCEFPGVVPVKVDILQREYEQVTGRTNED